MSAMVHPFEPHKLLWHRSRIEAMQRGEATRGPVSLEWDLSNTCNHQCPFCSFGTQESHGYRQQHWLHFPTDRAASLVPELREAGVESITFTGGGEPLMHPHASGIFRVATAHGIPWGLVTNGRLLRGDARHAVSSLARFVRVSLDAGTPETHQAMHRTRVPEFDLILEHMRETIRAASEDQSRSYPLTVGASMCVTDRNWMEIAALAGQLRAIGANYLEVRPTYPTTWRGDGWDMALANVSAAVQALADVKAAYHDETFGVVGMLDRFEQLAKPEKDYAKCQIGPLTSVLGADGRLWHCCVQRGRPLFELASVIGQSFADAWAQAQAKRLADIIDVGKCPRCRYDNYNRILEGVARDGFHAAFV